MIDELKVKLGSFDKAFERMFRDKASIKDLELLKLSVDESRAKTLFNDMKELFDTTMTEFKKQMESEKTKMRDAFAYMAQETQTKIGKKDLDYFMQRVERIEQLMSQFSYEHSKKVES